MSFARRKKQRSREYDMLSIENASLSNNKIVITWSSSSEASDNENFSKKSRMQISSCEESQSLANISSDIFNIEFETGDNKNDLSSFIEDFDEIKKENDNKNYIEFDESPIEEKSSIKIETFDDDSKENRSPNSRISELDFSPDSISFSNVLNSTTISCSFDESSSIDKVDHYSHQIINGGLDHDFGNRKHKKRKRFEENTTMLARLDMAIDNKKSEIAIWNHELFIDPNKDELLVKKFQIATIEKKYGLLELRGSLRNDPSSIYVLILNTKFDFANNFSCDNQVIAVYPPYKIRYIKYQNVFHIVYFDMYKILICNK